MFTIRGQTISDTSRSFVIAECSHNHQGSLVLAREMFRVAKQCGADAVKLQKRSPAFYAALRAKGLTEYASLREERELCRASYWALRDYAHHVGLDFLVTAFDVEAVEFLHGVGVDAMKAASGAVHNLELIDAMAQSGLPILLSTGCAELEDVDRAMMGVYRYHGNVCLLQCTSAYPCPDEAMHLRTIGTYRLNYPQTTIGLSSHHQGNYLEPVAYALGARIFEKHFTLSSDLGPGDHANSLDPAGLRELVQNLRAVEAAMGDGVKRFLPCEETGRLRLDVHYNPAAPAAEAMAV
jgi:N-acetylneuraminate synthase/sialic acid synthase